MGQRLSIKQKIKNGKVMPPEGFSFSWHLWIKGQNMLSKMEVSYIMYIKKEGINICGWIESLRLIC